MWAFNSGEPEKIDKSQIDGFVSKKLNKMSTKERSGGLNDLHGVADRVSESPEMVREKSQEMSNILASIANNGAVESLAYRKAASADQSYVDQLRLCFLRAESYNCQLAAERMIRFFNQKMELFGEEKLVQDLEFQDLTEEEKEALQLGLFQVLPQRDRAGRVVLFVSGVVNVKLEKLETVLRVSLYFCMAALQDKESQLNGTVLIYYGTGQKTQRRRTSKALEFWSAIPVRHVSSHYCSDSAVLDPARWIIAKIMESSPLSRLRFHFGTHVECVYNLMTFGIPRDAIPIQDDGSMDLSHHLRILEVLKRIENSKKDEQHKVSTSSKSSDTIPAACASILVPGPMDVIMGRGLRPKSRPGSLRLHHLLLENMDAYDAAGSKFEKTVIAETVLKQMKDSGCRFLRVTVHGLHSECDDLEARGRISTGFRNMRHKSKSDRTRSESGGNKSNTKRNRDA